MADLSWRAVLYFGPDFGKRGDYEPHDIYLLICARVRTLTKEAIRHLDLSRMDAVRKAAVEGLSELYPDAPPIDLRVAPWPFGPPDPQRYELPKKNDRRQKTT